MKLETNEIKNAIEVLSTVEFSLSDIVKMLEKCELYRKALLEKSPFKKGDTVVLTKTPDINEKDSFGWLGSKHFLIKGAKAKVAKVEMNSKGLYCYGLLFENDSYILSSGEIKFTQDKAQYSFDETYLAKDLDEECSCSKVEPILYSSYGKVQYGYHCSSCKKSNLVTSEGNPMTLTKTENHVIHVGLKTYLRDLNKLSSQNQNLGELSFVYKPELDNNIKVTENLIKLFAP